MKVPIECYYHYIDGFFTDFYDELIKNETGVPPLRGHRRAANFLATGPCNPQGETF